MGFEMFPTRHSCEICRSLVIEIFFREKTTLARSKRTKCRRFSSRVRKWLNDHLQEHEKKSSMAMLPFTVIFDMTLREVKANARDCSLCRFLLEPANESAFDSDEFLTAETRGSDLRFGILRIRRRLHNPEVIFGFFDDFEFIQRLDLITTEDNPGSLHVDRRPMNINPASESSFDIARGWLKQCLETHEACKRPAANYMPTRLIEIKRTEDHIFLKLVEGSRPVEPYTALSYCWGRGQDVTTTTQTIKTHLAEINHENLPKTLKDAIRVTEELGLRFLWIDALCIIQDNDTDKAWEIAQMPFFYNNALITIAASRADGVEIGFLHRRLAPDSYNPSSMFELPYRNKKGEIRSCICLPKADVLTEPLDYRAWALQERLLSTRYLEYATFQTRWTCLESRNMGDWNELFIATDGLGETTSYNGNIPSSVFNNASNLLQSDFKIITAEGRIHLTHTWHEIVRCYTHRSLTIPGDRILAISGIAETYARAFGNTYHAGLWISNLPSELFWSVTNISKLKPRLSTYQAPSWSWAAINVPATFFETKFPGRRDKDNLYDEAFSVIECTTQLRVTETKFTAADALEL